MYDARYEVEMQFEPGEGYTVTVGGEHVATAPSHGRAAEVATAVEERLELGADSLEELRQAAEDAL